MTRTAVRARALVVSIALAGMVAGPAGRASAQSLEPGDDSALIVRARQLDRGGDRKEAEVLYRRALSRGE